MAVDLNNVDPTLVVLEEDTKWYPDIHGEGEQTEDLGGQNGPNNIAVKELIGRSNFLKNRFKTNALAISKIQGKNHWINGGFNIWQYGESGIEGINSVYITDCLLGTGTLQAGEGSSIDWSRDIYLYEECIKFNNVNCNRGTFSTRLEEDRLRSLMGKTVTVSFDYAVSNDTDCTIGYGILTDDGYDVGAETHASAGVLVGDGAWHRAKVTLDIHDGANLLSVDGYLQFTVHYGNATGLINGDYRFTKCQIEIGDKGTPFEHIDKGLSLMLCKRYYEVLDYVEIQGVTYTANGDTRANKIAMLPKHKPPLITPSSLNLIVIGIGASTTPVNIHIVADLGVYKNLLYLSNLSSVGTLANYGAVVVWGDNGKHKIILNSEIY